MVSKKPNMTGMYAEETRSFSIRYFYIPKPLLIVSWLLQGVKWTELIEKKVRELLKEKTKWSCNSFMIKLNEHNYTCTYAHQALL